MKDWILILLHLLIYLIGFVQGIILLGTTFIQSLPFILSYIMFFFFILSFRSKIIEACQQMRDEALYARDSSMITEFHKRLVVRLFNCSSVIIYFYLFIFPVIFLYFICIWFVLGGLKFSYRKCSINGTR